MPYRRCGRSGLKLPAVSLGLWHNFGGVDVFENARAMIHRAFDLGITHFDLANNYGPPYGSAEETFGRLLSKDLGSYRDELVLRRECYDLNVLLLTTISAAAATVEAVCSLRENRLEPVALQDLWGRA